MSHLRVLCHITTICCFCITMDVPDIDQPCLSTSAGHKGPQGKLFILTSFQENKPRTLGASVPRGVQKRNPRGCPADEQLSLRGHDLSPASGYRNGGAAAEKTRPSRSKSEAAFKCCSKRRDFYKKEPQKWWITPGSNLAQVKVKESKRPEILVKTSGKSYL